MKNFEFMPYDRVVGVQPDWQEETERLLAAYYAEHGTSVIEGFELEKTQRDKEIIKFAEDAVSAYLRAYGREPKFDVPLEKIHFLRDGGTKEFTQGKLGGGAHATKFGSMLVDRSDSDIQTALITFHELFHTKSYSALQITTPDMEGVKKLEAYRNGFTVTSRDGREEYFHDFEEAVISLMTKRFYDEEISQNETFKKELDSGCMPDMSRTKEAGGLSGLVDDIWNSNRDSYSSREQVMDIFIKAQIDGNLLPVARLVESTYGEGSFRELGEITGRKVED